MSESNLNCPKCQNEMVEGFTVDYGDFGTKRPGDWVEGQPVKSFWSGGTKISDKKIYTTKTFRCSRCGFLESYATEEGSPAY